MEVYSFPEHERKDAYLIQDTESNPHLTNSHFKHFETMYNEGAPEFFIEQGLYYPTAANYGYICTGLESAGDWDDQQRSSGLDGQEIQYAGAQTENLPYLYYTPGYGYSESPYNPYNPYIPGAVVGVDGPVIGPQQYYTGSSYENQVSSPAYFPMVSQSRSDISSNGLIEPLVDTAASIPNRSVGSGLKHRLSSASTAFTLNPRRSASNQTNSFTRGSNGYKASAGPSKQRVTSSSLRGASSSQFFQGRGTQIIDNVSHGKTWSSRNQLEVSLPSGNGLSNFASSVHGQTVIDKLRPKFHVRRASNDAIEIPDVLTEQNRGPRTNKSENHLAVKAYTTRAGVSDAQGNITIYTDQYNKDDFLVDYANAKFFVIKSYSEDDVHKSIKYNVWSSTRNGNKKLNSAYDDAQQISAEPRGCPIFLFFSVNASGQFCGVAEMTGPVDFHKDMDFWQQDKWCGSFPVKWHIIKDVPNPNFRHIILENNEYKPVTSSRDTQEIRYNKGLEMLNIFKHYTSKTSLLDDFMYYENRQKLLQEERTRLLINNYESPLVVPLFEPLRKINGVDLPSREDEKFTKLNNAKNASASTEQVSLDSDVCSNISSINANDSCIEDEKAEGGILKIGSLSIHPKQTGMKLLGGDDVPAPSSATVVANEPANIVTIGSVPVNVNGFLKSSGLLTVGTITIDPGVLNYAKSGSREG